MALRCPRLFHYRYVDKLKEPEVSPEARIGKAVHHALELALQGNPTDEAIATAAAALDVENEQRRYELLCAGVDPFLRRIAQLRRRRRVNRQLVEYSLAVREDMTTTQFYAGDAYFRGVLDAGYLFDDTLALVDHKTGMRHPGAGIAEQLEGYAVLAASAFRNARQLWLGVHWVAERAVEWAPPVDVARVTDQMVPNLLDNIEAAALAVSDGPRTNPGPQCERCSFRAMCPAGNQPYDEPVEYEDDDDD